MPTPRPLRVFLCHAKEDKPAIRNLYKLLKTQSWIEPWLDEVNLLPGMDWELEIFKALRDADVILVCLSKESVAKEGYVQKEFKRALGFAEEKPEGAIYLIPLRLDDCTPPLKFQQWQWADYFQPEAQKKLLQSLYLRASSLSILPPPAKPAPVPSVSSSVSLPMPIPVAPASAKSTPGGHPIYIFGGLDFIKVPAGDFYMGANDLDNSKPEHLIYQLNYDFYMARFTVTNLQYSLMARETGAPIIMSKGKSQHLIVNISWQDAQKYVEWLNKKYKSELPNGYRFRLPSEAEWEKAARGAEGNEYPWGDTFDKNKCNSKEGGKGDTTPVGSYSPLGDSPYGCADMAGNVWEWCRSLYQPYPYNAKDGREDEKSSGTHVQRGGAYWNDRDGVRCAFRDDYGDLLYLNGNGFRVCASPISPE